MTKPKIFAVRTARIIPTFCFASLLLAACSGPGTSSSAANGGSGANGTGGTASAGGAGSTDFVANPGVCDAGKCNGKCLAAGETAGGCKFIGNIGSITLAAAQDGTLYSTWYDNVYELTLAPPSERKIEASSMVNSFSELAVSATQVFAGSAATGDGLVAYGRPGDAKTVLDATASDVAEMQIVGDTVYYQVEDFLGGAIKSVTATSTAPTTVIAGNNDILGLYVDSTHVYWSQETANSNFMHIEATLQRAPLGDLTKPEVLATATTAEHIVGNDTTLFWTSDAQVFTLPKAGGTPVQVALAGSHIQVGCATSAGVIVFQKAPTTEQLGRLLLVDATGKWKKIADISAADDFIVSGGRLYVEQANVGLYEVTLP